MVQLYCRMTAILLLRNSDIATLSQLRNIQIFRLRTKCALLSREFVLSVQIRTKTRVAISPNYLLGDACCARKRCKAKDYLFRVWAEPTQNY